ncbi:hypothetical protein WJX77_003843 [Trebouxia sp. C0004]
MSAFGQSGMSTPLSDISMPNIPTSRCPNQKASMNSGRGLYYYRGILSQDAEDALHAAAEGRLRRPLKVFVAPTKTVRAASGPQGGLRKLHRSLLLKRLPVQQVMQGQLFMLHHSVSGYNVNRFVQARQPAETQAASQNDNGVWHSFADIV